MGSILGWAALILVLAVAAAGGYIFVKRRRGLAPVAAERTEPGGRLEILEATPVDETRKLVLIRCDNVEHLMLVGGPGDIVVENDVRRSRAGGSAAAAVAPIPSLAPPSSLASAASKQTPRPALEARGNGAARRFGDALRAEPSGPAAKPGSSSDLQSPIVPPVEPAIRAPAQPRPSLAAVPASTEATSTQNGASPSPVTAPAAQSAARNGPVAAPAQAQRRAETKAKTPLDAKAANSAAKESPAEAAAPVVDRKPAGETAGAKELPRGPVLPVAQTPWPEGDSIENEIVRALRSDAQPPAPAPAPSQAAAQQAGSAPRAADNVPTTLGDLAERLEEALAREVQQANQGRGRLDLGLDAFVTDTKPTAVPTPKEAAAAARERGRGVLAAAPEPETRAQGRDGAPAERKEEAPVINLNARRRSEAADPLEDEMARLLGELTSDTNRR